jgi:putative ABC transport system permease protein
MLDATSQDLKYALRSMRKHPVFTTVAIFSLALGIGGNTAMFSLVNTLLLTKLPVRDPDALYQLMVTHRSATHNAFSYTDYQKLRDGFQIFDGVIAWSSRDLEVQVNDTPMQVHAAVVTGNFYDVLGVKAAAGRLLTPADDVAGGSNAVIGYGFWQRVFNRDPAIIGRAVRVQGVPMTIVGVTSPEFGGAEIDHPRDIILPVHAMKTLFPQSKILEATGAYWMHVMVRLRPGTTMASARPVLRDVWPRLLEADGPPPVDGWKQKLDIAAGASGFSGVRDEFSTAIIILMILVALVLLIACANLANLLLARATGRRKEIAVRLAIGAGRTRLLRQWLTESFLLAGIGACAGVLLATWITRGLMLFLPKGNASFLLFHLDTNVLLFTAAVTVLTALLFGLLPAAQASGLPPASILQEAGRGSSGRRAILTRAVVVAQVAVCLVLVVGAILFARSLRNLSRSNYGFNREGLLLVESNPKKAGIRGERVKVFYMDLLSRLNATPGIQTASCAAIVPLSGGAWWDPAVVPGYVPAKDERTTVYLNSVAPGYFAAMGTSILQGREFTAADDAKSRRVAIVNESFARRFFPSGALGRKFTVGPGDDPQTTDIEIVGIAANTKYARPDEPQKELVYVAMQQSENFGGTVLVRLSPGTSAAAASATIRDLIGNQIAVEVSPYDKVFERALQQDRMLALLSGLFGFMGIALACVGLYGVLSNAVNARTGEIGIRMALGAGRASVVWMILRESVVLAAIGAAIGIPIAMASSRVIANRLFGLAPGDPIALLLATIALLIVATVAGYLPAYRAASVDPAVALRAE